MKKTLFIITLSVLLAIASLFAVKAYAEEEKKETETVVVNFGNSTQVEVMQGGDYQVYTPTTNVEKPTKPEQMVIEDNTASPDGLEEYRSEFDFYSANKPDYTANDFDLYVSLRLQGYSPAIAYQKCCTYNVGQALTSVFDKMQNNPDIAKRMQEFLDFTTSEDGKNLLQRIANWFADLISNLKLAK